MTEPRDSLIEREEREPTLFDLPPAMAPMAREMATAGEYTGDDYFRHHPQAYKAIVWLTAEGVGILRIAELIRHVAPCSPNTVMAVQQREGGQIDIAKQRLGNMCRNGAQLCVEGIIEALVDPERRKKIPARDLAVIHGILTEKWQLLHGHVTARVEVRRGDEPTHDDYLKLIEALRTGGGAAEAGQKVTVSGALEAPGAPGRVIDVESSEVQQ